MKPSELYDIYFPYQEGHIDDQGRAGKTRPALIMTAEKGTAIAISVKITKSKPTTYFPNRIPIFNWQSANLTVPSFAEIDTLLPIPLEASLPLRGELHPVDFKNVLRAFRALHEV